jgi:hypothetical protein
VFVDKCSLTTKNIGEYWKFLTWYLRNFYSFLLFIPLGTNIPPPFPPLQSSCKIILVKSIGWIWLNKSKHRCLRACHRRYSWWRCASISVRSVLEKMAFCTQLTLSWVSHRQHGFSLVHRHLSALHGIVQLLFWLSTPWLYDCTDWATLTFSSPYTLF